MKRELSNKVLLLMIMFFLSCKKENIRYYYSPDKKYMITRIDRDDSTFFVHGRVMHQGLKYISVHNVDIRGGWEVFVKWKDSIAYFNQPYSYLHFSDHSDTFNMKILSMKDTVFYNIYNKNDQSLIKLSQNN